MNNEKREIIINLEDQISELQRNIDFLMEEDGELRVERLGSVFKRVDKLPKLIRYETGIDWFDREMKGGFNEGSFINLAAEGFAGKTTFVLKILENISNYNQVLFFSFEMYERLLRKRLEHFTELQLNNFLIEQKRNDLGQIESIIRQYAEAGGRFIAIDSRMKIKVSGKGEEWQKNSEISSRLSKLCQELGVIIIVINQISEGDLKTGRLSLKGSGDQFYDSDVVLFITVDKEDNRTMYCTKDRIGEKKWKHIMPLFDQSSQPEVTIYNEKDFPL